MKKFLFILFILTGLVVTFWSYREPHRDNEGRVVITLKKNGFSPESVRVAQGTRVVFRAVVERPYWPASNFHPRHLLYVAFDPGRAIAKNEEWEFTFDRLGTWRYHNHLRPMQQGVIVVFDPKTGSQSACPEYVAREDMGSKVTCWYEKLTATIETEGVEEAFALVGRLYDEDPDFVSTCHDMIHLIGEAAYRLREKGKNIAIGSDVSSCGYGFFHGFIEALMFGRGRLEEAFTACNSAKSLSGDIVSSNAIYACYHGIGHGLFDSLEASVWGNESIMAQEVLAVCNQVSEPEREELRKQCATGVFNALANAYMDGRYGLALRSDDPTWVCQEQEDSVFRSACMNEVSIVAIRTKGFDRASATQFIQSLPTIEDQSIAIFAYMADEGRRQFADIDPETVASWCRPFTSALRAACLEGLEIIMIERSRPGKEADAALRLCGSDELSAQEKDTCFRYLIPRLSTVYTKGALSEVCGRVPVQYQPLCQAGE